MTVRRVFLGGIAVALLAVVGLVPATATGAASTGAASSKTICVGVVIDARSIGGSVHDGCATVKPGTTGVGVLEAGGHSVTFRSDGLLCTIDGLPTSGCSGVDNSHYWAYYHRAPDRTTWSYSNEGASTYEPVNRSTEGWVYDDGTSLKPENVPAASICAALVKTPTAPTPSPLTSRRSSPAASATPSPSASQSKSASTGRVHHSRSPRATSSPAGALASGSPASPSSSASPPSPAGSSVSPVASSAATKSSGHGSATGVLIAAGVIVVLAAAGATAARRRRT